MKNGISSLVVSLFGIILIYVMNNQTLELYKSELARLNQNEPNGVLNTPEIHTQIGFGIFIGLIALYFAIKQFREVKWFGILTCIVALFLIYLDFVPFWEFQIGDTMSDINFN